MPAPQPLLRIGRGGDAHHAARGAKAERAVAQAEARHRIDEAGRPAAAAEFAVGDARQAERLLEVDDLADAVVLHGAKAGVVELSGLVRTRGVDEPRRPHEAADVLGVEGRLHSINCIAMSTAGRTRRWSEIRLRQRVPSRFRYASRSSSSDSESAQRGIRELSWCPEASVPSVIARASSVEV